MLEGGSNLVTVGRGPPSSRPQSTGTLDPRPPVPTHLSCPIPPRLTLLLSRVSLVNIFLSWQKKEVLFYLTDEGKQRMADGWRKIAEDERKGRPQRTDDRLQMPDDRGQMTSYRWQKAENR